MDRLLRLLVSVKESKWGEQGGATDDDGLVERLSRRYTSTLLAAFAMMVTTKQFVGEPISCWCPTYFTDGQRQYTNNNAAAHLVLVSDLLHRRTATVHQQQCCSPSRAGVRPTSPTDSGSTPTTSAGSRILSTCRYRCVYGQNSKFRGP